MRVLFTTTKLPVSWLIRKVTGEPVSHCAIEFDNIVVHSEFTGVEIVKKEDFLKIEEILYSVEIPSDSEKFYQLVENYVGASYDYRALFYLFLQYLMKAIGIKIPNRNLWKLNGSYLCTELVTEAIFKESDAEITPYKLYLKLKDMKWEK